MADISGPGGNATMMSGVVLHISAWSGTLNVTTVENTGFVEVGNRSYLATAQVFTGSVVGTGESGANNTPIPSAGLGATPSFSSYTGSITLTAASGCTYAFPAVLSSVNLGRPNDGKYDVTANFMSSGAITQAQG